MNLLNLTKDVPVVLANGQLKTIKLITFYSDETCLVDFEDGSSHYYYDNGKHYHTRKDIHQVSYNELDIVKILTKEEALKKAWDQELADGCLALSEGRPLTGYQAYILRKQGTVLEEHTIPTVPPQDRTRLTEEHKHPSIGYLPEMDMQEPFHQDKEEISWVDSFFGIFGLQRKK